MNLNIVDDTHAEKDFCYKKIGHYQIFVKKSVYQKMLFQEYKSIRNWLFFIFSLVIGFLNVAVKSLVAGLFLSIVVTLYFGDFGELGVESLANMLGKNIQDLVTVSDLYELIFAYELKLKVFILIAFILELFHMGLYVKNNGVANNTFTQQVFYKLHHQAEELEAYKNG